MLERGKKHGRATSVVTPAMSSSALAVLSGDTDMAEWKRAYDELCRSLNLDEELSEKAWQMIQDYPPRSQVPCCAPVPALPSRIPLTLFRACVCVRCRSAWSASTACR